MPPFAPVLCDSALSFEYRLGEKGNVVANNTCTFTELFACMFRNYNCPRFATNRQYWKGKGASVAS
ncbi:MAG: hypothetical protein HYR83_02980 [Planctomycetes bacterium]|nr:hypothetical protein [Planctomycetota bacterium]